MADTRKRIWVFELYPDSMPERSMELLSSIHVPIAMSPCHCSDFVSIEDVNNHPDYYKIEEIGVRKKKAHYHLIIAYDGKKSRENVLDDLEPLGVNFVMPCSCVKSYYRYLCHLDEKDKVHYSTDGIVLFGGFSPDDYISDNADAYVPSMMMFLNDHPDMDFPAFCTYCLETRHMCDPETGEYLNHWEWFLVLTNVRTQLFVSYIRALHSRKKQKGDYDE